MNGIVNTHNTVKYAPRGHPPEFNFDRNGREKITVWAELYGNGRVLGLCLFDGNVDEVS